MRSSNITTKISVRGAGRFNLLEPFTPQSCPSGHLTCGGVPMDYVWLLLNEDTVLGVYSKFTLAYAALKKESHNDNFDVIEHSKFCKDYLSQEGIEDYSIIRLRIEKDRRRV